MENKIYDVVFHLVGEEKVPNLLGVLQLSSKKHVFIKSKDFASTYIKNLLNGALYDEILVNPFDINNVIEKLQKYIEDNSINSKNAAFNLTGGTKMMFTGAYLVSNEIDADAFYFDTANKNMISLNDNVIYPIKQIKSVKTFLDLGSEIYYIQKNGKSSLSEERAAMAKKLLKYNIEAKEIHTLYNNLSKKNKNIKFESKYYGHIYVEYYSTTSFKLKIEDIECTYNDVNFSAYVDGGWFEDYVLTILKDYEKQGRIYDLHSGMIMADVKTHRKMQEFDAIFTDGLNLFIIELKAGTNINVKDINKIKVITNNFGGRFARPVFISLYDNQGIKNRAILDKVPYFYGKDFENQLKEHLDKILT